MSKKIHDQLKKEKEKERKRGNVNQDKKKGACLGLENNKKKG